MAATEVSSAGYQDLRDYVQSTWKYVEVRNGSGSAIMRLQVGVDSRVVWSHNAGAQTLEATISLAGSDTELSGILPVTIASCALFKVATGGTAFHSNTFNEGTATLSATGDTVVVKYQVQIPAIS